MTVLDRCRSLRPRRSPERRHDLLCHGQPHLRADEGTGLADFAVGLRDLNDPEGTKQSPVNPLALALASGASFIAQSFSSDAMRHAEIVQKAIEHDGFGFVNVFSPCVTFNDVDTYDYFRDNLVDLQEEDHDPTDYEAAKEVILDSDKEYQGVMYQDENSVPYHEKHGVTEDMSEIPDGAPDDAMDLVREFY
nr:hypothetical protein [Haloterrigena sp. H1]